MRDLGTHHAIDATQRSSRMPTPSVFGRLVSPDLDEVRPYIPGLTVAEASAKYGIPPERIVKLSSNENPLGPAPMAVIRAESRFPDLHRYPDSLARSLRQKIAEVEGLGEENVIIGAGSSEIMSFIVRAFSRRGDEVLSLDPGFDVYSEIAAQEGRVAVRVLLDFPYEPTFDQFASKVTERTRIIFVTRPNNPTSRLIPLDVFLQIADFAQDAVVISDEAYIEFAHDYRSKSAAAHILERPNILVSRTLSKAYAVPNLRVGYVLGRSEAITYLFRIKPKWNVGEVAQQAAIGALEDTDHLRKTLETVEVGRDYLVHELDRRGLTAVPEPQGNFVMASVASTGHGASEFTELLAAEGVLIRGDFHADYVRISVGTSSDNEAAIRAIDAVFATIHK